MVLYLLPAAPYLQWLRKERNTFARQKSFAEQKWDMKKGQPLESGTTIDDVLKFVRQSIYEYVNKNKGEMSGDEEDNDDTDNNENNDSGSSKSDSLVGEIEAPDSYISPG